VYIVESTAEEGLGRENAKRIRYFREGPMTGELERSLYLLADKFLSEVKSRNPGGLDYDAALNEFKKLVVMTGTPEERITQLMDRIIPEPEVPEFIRPRMVLQSSLSFLLGQPLRREGHSHELAENLVYKFLRDHEQELVEKHGFGP
jgi:hypothetical protein